MLTSPPRAANSVTSEIASNSSSPPLVSNAMAAENASAAVHENQSPLSSAKLAAFGSSDAAPTPLAAAFMSSQRRMSSSTASDSIAPVSPRANIALSEMILAIQDIFRAETASLAADLNSTLTASLTASLSAHLRQEMSEELRRWQTTCSAGVSCPTGSPPAASARRLSMAMLDDASMTPATDGDASWKSSRKSSRFTRSLKFSIIDDEDGESIINDGGAPNVSVNGKRLSVLAAGTPGQLPIDDFAECERTSTQAQRKSIRSSLLDEPLTESPSLSSLKRPSSQRIRRRSFRFLSSSEIIDEENSSEVAQGSSGGDVASHELSFAATKSTKSAVSAIVPLHTPQEELARIQTGSNSQRSSISSIKTRCRDPSDADSNQKFSEEPGLVNWNTSQSSKASSAEDSQLAGSASFRLDKCRNAARSIVEWTVFDYCISTLVILNAASIGIQANYMVGHISEETPSYFRIAETVFGVLWTAELALRLSVYRCTFFTMAGWRWNLFDTTVVGLQLFEELVSAVVNTRNAMPTNLNAVRLLRVLRLVRIIRLVRLLRFIQELRTMVCSIANSFRSLCWTIVLLMLMVYVVSVCLTQLIADHGQVHPEVFAEDKLLQEYYGSLLRSVLSLFQAITGGLDWNELLAPLMLHISPLIAVVFSFYICFAVLAMMNVITGVFVESALTAAKADRDGDLLTQLHSLFLKIDVDRSGVISWEEFAGQLDDPHMEQYFKALDIDASEAYGLFALLDVNNSGEINVEEFVLGCLRLRGAAQAIDLATLTYFNKRMSTRWRNHAQRVEAMLSDILELMLSDQACGERATEAISGTISRHNSYPSLLESMTSEASSDLATWAELKAKGEAARQRGRGSFTSQHPPAQTASQSKKLKRSCTAGLEERQGLKPVAEAGSSLCPLGICAAEHQCTARNGASTLSASPVTRSGSESQSPSFASSAMSGMCNDTEAVVPDIKEEDLVVSNMTGDEKDCLFAATWAELKADGERRRDERRSCIDRSMEHSTQPADAPQST